MNYQNLSVLQEFLARD